MVKGTTESGFAYSIDPEVVRDMEFIELAAAAKDDGLLLPKLIVRVLGEKQKKALYEHVRNKKGFVPVEAISSELEEILLALNTNAETKNS